MILYLLFALICQSLKLHLLIYNKSLDKFAICFLFDFIETLQYLYDWCYVNKISYFVWKNT